LKKFLFVILFASAVMGQAIDFTREDLTFRLEEKSFSVDGFYWFVNKSDSSAKTRIIYPFPNASIEPVDEILVENVSIPKAVAFHKQGNEGITFYINTNPKDTTLIHIKYRQSVKGDSAVYILTSTSLWNKPLENAEYKMICPGGIKVQSFSYPPDKVYQVESNTIFYWKKNNFMPVKDMVFHFSSEKPHEE
jgi:hypothetical protein